MAEVLDWQSITDQHAMVLHAVRALTEGQVVALPTDAGIALAASALRPEAVDHLVQLRGAVDDDPVSIAVGGPDHALDWAPDLGPFGRRVLRRCWPGPVTLLLTEGVAEGLVRRLPESVRAVVCPESAVALRNPAHDALLHILDGLAGPLLLCQTVRRRDGAVPVGRVLGLLGDNPGLVIDDGPDRSETLASLVRVNPNGWSMIREGAVTEEDLRRQTAWLTVFVCTGNTCRSPMAAALFAKLVADRLGCTAAELPGRGFVVLSAGVSAIPGDEAAAEAIEAVRPFGADLTGHVSQPLSADLVQGADLLVTMTRSHLSAVLHRFGRFDPRPRLLCSEGEDIADPIGSPREVYDDCARQILRRLERLLSELPLP
jgi:protein-tyrosine phosphatase